MGVCPFLYRGGPWVYRFRASRPDGLEDYCPSWMSPDLSRLSLSICRMCVQRHSGGGEGGNKGGPHVCCALCRCVRCVDDARTSMPPRAGPHLHPFSSFPITVLFSFRSGLRDMPSSQYKELTTPSPVPGPLPLDLCVGSLCGSRNVIFFTRSF